MNHLDFIKVYSNEWPKIRLGNKECDGGYVIKDIPAAKYDILISGGIERDITFESEFYSLYNTRCVAFDHTINKLPDNAQNIEWIKKAITQTNSDTTTNLIEYIETYNNIFLKLDIEGGEYDLFNILIQEYIQKIDQMVVEFHSPWGNENKMNILKKIHNTHVILHAHGNNCCDGLNYGGAIVPLIFELTFVNRNLINADTLAANTAPIPGPLDRPNVPQRPDWVLDGYPFVW